jgi:putative flippase GtrA
MVPQKNSEGLPMKDKKTEVIRALKFLGFSISAGVIEIVAFTLLNELTTWSYWPCYLIALILSVLWNFTLNRQFTFRSTANIPIAMLKVAAYYAVFTPISTLAGEYLAEKAGWNEYLVTGLNMFFNLVTEYLFDTYVVFGKTIDTNKRAQKIKEKKAADEKNSMTVNGD